MKKITPKAEHGRITVPKNTFFGKTAWPSVCRDEKGTLYAVASSMRLSHVDPTGKNCMYISLDDGKTWSKPIVLNDSFADDRDMGITYMGNGRLLVTWFTTAPHDYMDWIAETDWFDERHKAICGGFSKAWKLLPEDVYKACNGSYVMISENYGISWTDPIRVPVSAPHGPSVCSDGSLIYLGTKAGPSCNKESNVCLYTSRDGGYTWEYTGGFPNAEDGISTTSMYEPHVIELPNGRLLGAVRVGREKEPNETVYISFSDDKGKTWSAPKSLETEGIPPQLMVHSSGAVILSWCCRINGRRSERALVSYDNGESWTEDYVINDRCPKDSCDMGYPCTVEMGDGSLFTVYYQPWPTEGQWSSDLLYTHWNLED